MKLKSLIAKIKKEPAPPSRIGPLAWWQTTDKETQKQLFELRRAYQGGELPGWNVKQLYERIRRDFMIKTTVVSFQRFMRQSDE